MQAMQLHKEGKEDEALSIYTQLVDENFNDITPYLNGSSILRKKEVSKGNCLCSKGSEHFSQGRADFITTWAIALLI